MNENALKFAKYWRNSLVDAENDAGGLKFDGLSSHIRLSFEALQSGYLGRETVSSLFKDEAERCQSIEVSIRPWVFKARLEHGKVRSGMHAIVTPLIGHVRVNRHGQLFPTANTVIPRDILEPLESGCFSLGDVAGVDSFLAVNTLPGFEPPEDGQAANVDEYAKQWAAYLAFCERFVEDVSPGWLQGDNGYELSSEWCLFKEEKISGASQHIVRLYDHMRDTNPNSALFERYASQVTLAPEPCLPKNAGFAARLGHASDQYSLADEQRDALAHFLASRHGDILGVNGPPGTGKTTLLLSVVASLWAESALAQTEPPVIVASSTNNQAVTNILDAFGSDFAKGNGPFAGRWLPDINSFGAYFASSSADPETVRKYQSQSFFTNVESANYLARAQTEWLSNARVAFSGIASLTVEAAVKQLHLALQARADELQKIEQSWYALVDARQALRSEWGDAPDASIKNTLEDVQKLKAESTQLKALETSFRQYLVNEPIWYVLFAWLGPVQQKRLLRARLHIEQNNSVVPQTSQTLLSETQLEQLGSLSNVSAIGETLAAWRKAVTDEIATLEAKVIKGEGLLRVTEQCLANWQVALQPLQLPADAITRDMTLGDCDSLADTRIRFPIFLLSTHYWEGRWLLELEQTLPDILKNPKANGRKTLEKRWHRWMKLTPCVVSTFFMLPSYLKGSKYNGSGYDESYMYELIDLLIVDEAGQVLPEVAGASFALAKKALVIGDTLQIEPIWSIPASVDIGNLMSACLLPRVAVNEAYEKLCATGVSASSGSVMHIAQNASRYHYDTDMERGMFLYEHRRCYDSIVDYCNALCYQGKLVPRRGEKPQGGLPALGYLHVDGICQQQNGRSRMNRLEAETIAEWLVAHRSQLKALYGQDLWKIVGVITPFGAQSQAIAEACDARGIKTGKGDGELTVGTVHSFQGAARPVVIFSAVYSKHANGGFIDSRSSMLNVAVSRAKDSFLVFGDMDLFGMVPEAQPRGLLAEYLLRDAASELFFQYQPRKDLQTSRSTLSHLINAPAHDCFLLKTLSTATHEVHIVSPWIILQRIHDIGAWDAMSAAVARGVNVKVYTDLDFNSGVQWEKNPSDALKHALSALRGQKIESHVVRKVHSKIVMADDDLLCMGSFNWFSANRGTGANYETSMVYEGPDVTSEISIHRQHLAKRIDPIY